VTLRIIIAEDEILSADLLVKILSELEEKIGAVIVLDICHSGEEAFESTKKHRPDILFLDVNMPAGDGFSVLEKLTAIGFQFMPAVIFTTAHSRFAAKAFEVEALDYLLKPLSADKVLRAVTRVKRAESIPIAATAFIVKIPTVKGIEFVHASDIEFIKSDGDYLQVHFSGRMLMYRGALRNIADDLCPRFCQCHRSYLVNLDYVHHMERRSKGAAILSLASGAEIPVSRSFRSNLFVKLPGS
jgi:two-component system, LytTR family, response regulator